VNAGRYLRPALTAAAIASLAPVVVRRGDLLASGTEALLLLLAAVGLNLAVGYAGAPSLGQGGFAALGAYGTAILVAREGWNVVAALGVGTAIAIAGGMLVARGVARLRPAFVAAATWLFAWAISFAIAAFPGLTGGTRGVSIGESALDLRAFGVRWRLGPVAYYEIALAAVVVALVGTVAVLRRYGPAFEAVRSDPAAARAAGIPVDRVRFGAIAASAGIGGFAGGLLALSAGVADPTSYGPLLSVTLFVVVLLGGAGHLLGPAAGIAVVLLLGRIATELVTAAGGSAAHVEPFTAAAILGGVLALGARGLIPRLESRVRADRQDGRPRHFTALVPHRTGGALHARGLAVAFGGVTALDDVTIDVPRGTCHVVIGPNGSGKTTLLRVLGGALAPARGSVVLDGRALDGQDPIARARAGVVRTLQRTAVPGGVTVFDYVLAGAEPNRNAGPLRTLVRSPVARADERQANERAAEALSATGLIGVAHASTETLSGAQQRTLQIARALASAPRVLLLDEPAAGVGADAEASLREVIESLRDAGSTIVIVEHNLRFVGAVADGVSVLDAGKLIASGTLAQVADDPVVRAAYLGPDIITARATDTASDRARAPRRGLQRKGRAIRRRGGDRGQRSAREGGTRGAAHRARGEARRGGDQRRRGR
jgi:ABC-type branched-subunit amino acid transport system ATPase component/ABC-type branched-subunit amino acid transport system permease subunit